MELAHALVTAAMAFGASALADVGGAGMEVRPPAQPTSIFLLRVGAEPAARHLAASLGAGKDVRIIPDKESNGLFIWASKGKIRQAKAILLFLEELAGRPQLLP